MIRIFDDNVKNSIKYNELHYYKVNTSRPFRKDNE